MSKRLVRGKEIEWDDRLQAPVVRIDPTPWSAGAEAAGTATAGKARDGRTAVAGTDGYGADGTDGTDGPVTATAGVEAAGTATADAGAEAAGKARDGSDGRDERTATAAAQPAEAGLDDPLKPYYYDPTPDGGGESPAGDDGE